MVNDLPAGERVLATCIPERRTVEGLDYGRHVSTPGWSGYYVRPSDCDMPMMVARLDPEHLDGDAETVDAITAEMGELLTTAERVAVAFCCDGQRFEHPTTGQGTSRSLPSKLPRTAQWSR